MKLSENVHKTTLENLNKDSINSIEIVKNSTTLATCSDSDLVLYNLSSKTQSSLFSASTGLNSFAGECNCLKCINDHILLASQGRHICLYDINELKQVNRLKFNQDVINCLELAEIGTCQISNMYINFVIIMY